MRAPQKVAPIAAPLAQGLCATQGPFLGDHCGLPAGSDWRQRWKIDRNTGLSPSTSQSPGKGGGWPVTGSFQPRLKATSSSSSQPAQAKLSEMRKSSQPGAKAGAPACGPLGEVLDAEVPLNWSESGDLCTLKTGVFKILFKKYLFIWLGPIWLQHEI